MRLVAAIAAVVVSSGCVVDGHDRVRGRVLGGGGAAPIAGASVKVGDGAERPVARTGEDGRYEAGYAFGGLVPFVAGRVRGRAGPFLCEGGRGRSYPRAGGAVVPLERDRTAGLFSDGQRGRCGRGVAASGRRKPMRTRLRLRAPVFTSRERLDVARRDRA